MTSDAMQTSIDAAIAGASRPSECDPSRKKTQEGETRTLGLQASVLESFQTGFFGRSRTGLSSGSAHQSAQRSPFQSEKQASDDRRSTRTPSIGDSMVVATAEIAGDKKKVSEASAWGKLGRKFKAGAFKESGMDDETPEEGKEMPSGRAHWANCSQEDALDPQGQIEGRNKLLGVISRVPAFSSLSVQCQVALARELRRHERGEDAIGPIFEAGSKANEQRRLVVLDSGVLELLLPSGPQGRNVLVGRVGPGSVLGGLFALGVSTCQLVTVQPSTLFSEENDGDDAPELEDWMGGGFSKADLRQAPVMYSLSNAQILKLERNFAADFAGLRKETVANMQRHLTPYMRHATAIGFLSQCQRDFVDRMTDCMQLRMFKPRELIFKEKSPARHIGILLTGKLEVISKGVTLGDVEEMGRCVGEAALLVGNAKRSATVRNSDAQECLMGVLRQEEWVKVMEEFPEAKAKLEDQVQLGLTQFTLASCFVGADPHFLRFLSMKCEVLRPKWGETVISPDSAEAALFLCHQGSALVHDAAGGSSKIRRGEGLGFELGVGIRQGRNACTVIGGHGCVLIRMTYQMLEEALLLFPAELKKIMQALGFTLPPDHPFLPKADFRRGVVLDLLSRALIVPNRLDDRILEVLEPSFRMFVYNEGVTISEQGEACDQTLFFLSGKVRFLIKGKMEILYEAPTYFNQTLCRHRASLIATSTCVVWSLPACATHTLDSVGEGLVPLRSSATLCEHAYPKSLYGLVPQLEKDSSRLQQDLQASYQARLRNMRAFRRLPSEILEVFTHFLVIETFLPQTDIITHGKEVNTLYVILKGSAETVTAESGSGRSRTFEEGATVGEGLLLGQLVPSATVRASTLCICSAVHRNLLAYTFQRFPEDQGLAELRDMGRSSSKGLRRASSQHPPEAAAASPGDARTTPGIGPGQISRTAKGRESPEGPRSARWPLNKTRKLEPPAPPPLSARSAVIVRPMPPAPAPPAQAKVPAGPRVPAEQRRGLLQGAYSSASPAPSQRRANLKPIAAAAAAAVAVRRLQGFQEGAQSRLSQDEQASRQAPDQQAAEPAGDDSQGLVPASQAVDVASVQGALNPVKASARKVMMARAWQQTLQPSHGAAAVLAESRWDQRMLDSRLLEWQAMHNKLDKAFEATFIGGPEKVAADRLKF